MALNNSQYNEVMRNYERQQLKNRYSQQSRVEEVYGRLPQIKALDDEIRAWGASLARQALGGETAGSQGAEALPPGIGGISGGLYGTAI